VLTGVVLLGGVAWFNEMSPEMRALVADVAAEAARTAAQSLVANAVATYDGMMGRTDAAAPQQPARVAAAPRAGAARAGDSTPARRVAAWTAEAEPPSGNPLWALPLKQLSMTRDRPIFSPSRRPPPPPGPAFVAPVAVRQPVKPPEPERPTVSLLGTIVGANADDQIGVFLDTATQSVIRLRVGEDHQGWVLSLIKSREATLVKSGEQTVVIAMPAPGEGPLPPLNPGGMPGLPWIPPPVVPPGYANGTLPIPAVQAQQRQRRQR
jgi:general secretion pathway protein N